ncbi:MAG: 23S rRNA (uracil(1939)-C(5))-methyltransferase RlmD [Bacteroidota bacterium]|nr:23S rRNA (uracil(1939)-C(5))-methyltransferase RlmD [Bacteroidota bacterium]
MGRNNRKNQNFILEKVSIGNVAAEGKCVARYDNQVIFVEGVAPGDVADLLVTNKKKSFMEAKPLKFHEYSPFRQLPFCAHFKVCGGCKWQHINYDTQLEYKRQQVIDNLERIAKVALPEINPILASPQDRYYRNKLEFTFSNKRWLTTEEIKSEGKLSRNALGFHIPKRFDKIINVEHCHLQPDPSNTIRVQVRGYAEAHNLSFFDMVEQTGFLRNLIIRNTTSGEIMVIVQFAYQDDVEIENLMGFLEKRFPEISSLLYIVNTKKNEIFHDLPVITYAGKPYITEEMEGLQFRIGPKSFFQTNALQAYELYRIARDFAGLTGQEIVYDLYTGTGTIANFVAKNALKVIGLEYVPEAIDDAIVNSQINNINNTVFYAGDIQDLLNDTLINQHGQPDVVITDPPRAGMHVNVVEMLLKIKAPKIVYISCNPATQARDLALLDQKYKVLKVQPVDMFPHTQHVENIVLLRLRGEDE